MDWIEAEIIADPIRANDLVEPHTLVRRRPTNLVGIQGQELLYLPGPSHISLFTGAGGFDLGLEQAGFCTLVQHEIVKEACETLLVNRPRCFRHSALIQGDIRTTPTSMILREAGLRTGEAHLVTGGPPCQGFTWNNTQRGKKHDERNDLVFEFLRVVREAQPEFFVFENVPGFQQLNKQEYLKRFLETAYAGYYELVYGLIEASAYHVPQYRCRFICSGTRRDLFEIDGKLAVLPEPECFGVHELQRIKMLRAGPLFDNELRSRIRRPGIRYFPDRPVLSTPMPLRGADDAGGERMPSKRYFDFYDRLEREEPDRLVSAPDAA